MCYQNQRANLYGYELIPPSCIHQTVPSVKARGLGRQAFLAAITEGGVQNHANNGVSASFNYRYDNVGSDHDCVGLFQQRVAGYINIAEQFSDRMVKFGGCKNMDVGILCQKVQVPAYPVPYNDNVPQAKSMCSALGS
ncbi:hypothetical protein K437DRAFT_269754 [Tilletiaria anomala UBC 951]|uniref:Uncharacterized protein n=1 Tax=Tilletiaria anomala (strain ATCC 24038 / CBS 436.72 / UBC 951) TaxID=1037660 RepID=A0A066VIA8_TILAU|nr:uncharacterized protein K437DRAFT_269754 [Tilletiaria anomala UBC 951]KDN41236.1 hypothetical protein K437DRAFT_269754 [Tilletiaria anomala UBC 951]